MVSSSGGAAARPRDRRVELAAAPRPAGPCPHPPRTGAHLGQRDRAGLPPRSGLGFTRLLGIKTGSEAIPAARLAAAREEGGRDGWYARSKSLRLYLGKGWKDVANHRAARRSSTRPGPSRQLLFNTAEARRYRSASALSDDRGVDQI